MAFYYNHVQVRVMFAYFWGDVSKILQDGKQTYE